MFIIDLFRTRTNAAKYIEWLKKSNEDEKQQLLGIIDQRDEHIHNLHVECKDWVVDYVELRDKLHKMHRRAQKAEASRTHAFNQMAAVHRGGDGFLARLQHQAQFSASKSVRLVPSPLQAPA